MHSVLAHKEPLWIIEIKGAAILDLMREGAARWGQPRTFQYSGITYLPQEMSMIGQEALCHDRFYSIAAPSFFFEREFMDASQNLLPQFQDSIRNIRKTHEDLREPFSEIVARCGIGKWVRGRLQHI